MVRVEISLNDGESWRLCKVTHPSPCTKYGKYWCWNLWEVEADLIELLQAKEIVVRAWDFAMNTQPQKITWNLMVSSACLFSQLPPILHNSFYEKILSATDFLKDRYCCVCDGRG